MVPEPQHCDVFFPEASSGGRPRWVGRVIPTDIWLVVWNMFFPYLGNFIIPTDELMFFRGIGLNHQPDMVVIGYAWRHLKPSICFNMHCQRLGLQKSYGPSGTSNRCSKDAFIGFCPMVLPSCPLHIQRAGKTALDDKRIFFCVQFPWLGTSTEKSTTKQWKLEPENSQFPYAPCIEYLSTFALKITQFCRWIYQHHGSHLGYRYSHDIPMIYNISISIYCIYRILDIL